ncbi:MAG: GTP 3',8-cyclase MoaA [Candidatus Poseidoniales archaeon]|nr:MAG: GTP 3',8-cyclase MoaA [Candidatus Poseidoniales archaeon]
MTLVDARNRPLRDLRISVTDRCNFRCTYCMPREHFGPQHSFLPRDELLTYEEMTFVTASLLPLGLEKIRLTGGEPLLRKNITTLIGQLRELDPTLDIALTTNGALLFQHAASLKKAGLNRVTVSIDALDEGTFQSLADTTSHTPELILKGIEKAIEVGLGVKVNTVVKKGVNDEEILPLAEKFESIGVPLRFIEFMDVGNTNAWQMEDVMSGANIRELLAQRFGTLTPVQGQQASEVAKRYSTSEGYEFGFIESVTSPFCGDCTRARLSANGQIYTCLFATKGHDIKSILRMGGSTQEIGNAIASIWTTRNDRYSEERGAQRRSDTKVEMSFIGG